MTIGVDAGALCVQDDRLKVGVYRVILRLFQGLSSLDEMNDYRLYSFAPISDNIMKTLSSNMASFVLKPQKGWFQVRLPLSLLIHPVDLFLGVSQAVPVGFQTNIGFIYDLGFLHYPSAYPHSYHHLAKRTKELIHRSDHIITISETTKQDICQMYHVQSEKITVAYPGVDERFSRDGKAFQGTLPYFLHVGSLKPGKNIPVVIRAFHEFLKRSNKRYLLLIIGGDYWMDKEIFQTIQQEGMEYYVRFLGYVPDNLLSHYYRGASAFVTASLTEGFCLPVMEAMACGCPVVATKSAVFPEIIPEQHMLVEPNDIHALAQAMTDIITNDSLRNVSIASGLAKASEFSWKRFSEIVYGVITEMLRHE